MQGYIVPLEEIKSDLGDMEYSSVGSGCHTVKIPKARDPAHLQRAGHETRVASPEKSEGKEKGALTAATVRTPMGGRFETPFHLKYIKFEEENK